MSTTALDDLVTQAEAAVELNVSSGTVTRYIRHGLLDTVKIGPRRRLVTRASIDRLLRGGDDGQRR